MAERERERKREIEGNTYTHFDKVHCICNYSIDRRMIVGMIELDYLTVTKATNMYNSGYYKNLLLTRFFNLGSEYFDINHSTFPYQNGL